MSKPRMGWLPAVKEMAKATLPGPVRPQLPTGGRPRQRDGPGSDRRHATVDALLVWDVPADAAPATAIRDLAGKRHDVMPTSGAVARRGRLVSARRAGFLLDHLDTLSVLAQTVPCASLRTVPGPWLTRQFSNTRGTVGRSLRHRRPVLRTSHTRIGDRGRSALVVRVLTHSK